MEPVSLLLYRIHEDSVLRLARAFSHLFYSSGRALRKYFAHKRHTKVYLNFKVSANFPSNFTTPIRRVTPIYYSQGKRGPVTYMAPLPGAIEESLPKLAVQYGTYSLGW